MFMRSGVVSLITQTVTIKSKAFRHLLQCAKILSKTQNLIENKNTWTIISWVGLFRFIPQNWKTAFLKDIAPRRCCPRVLIKNKGHHSFIQLAGKKRQKRISHAVNHFLSSKGNACRHFK